MNAKKSSKRRGNSSSSSSSSSSGSRNSSKSRNGRKHSRSPSVTKRSSATGTRGRDDNQRSRTSRSLKSKWDSPEERHRKRGDMDTSSTSQRRRAYHDDRRRHRQRARSRSPRQPSRSNDSRHRHRRRRRRSDSYDHSQAVWGKQEEAKPAPASEKERPNFALSGKLTEESNTYRGVVIKYSEPPEAHKPKRRWRLYPFKGEKAMQTLYIHRESAYLIGRDRKVVDLPVDHPSCSKQHAALQYRLVQFTRDDGTAGKRVRPYIIDLESANGTYINNKRIEPKKYVELLERDVIKFAFSSREYVLLHENSKDETQDDDVEVAAAPPPPAAAGAPSAET